MTFSTRIPRVLLTNDDGIDAPGLAVLTEIAHDIADEVWIVAPEHDQSGTGQSLSIHNAIRCWPRGDRRWAVAGTPADCVGMALGHLMRDNHPSLILSGINAGSNVGDEVNLSGTVGAAFMGVLMNVPSIAISIDCVTRPATRWETARIGARRALAHVLETSWPRDKCLSINIPDCAPHDLKGMAWSRQSSQNIGGARIEQREDKRGLNYYWLTIIDQTAQADDNSDVSILARNEISLILLGNDRSVDADRPAVKF